MFFKFWASTSKTSSDDASSATLSSLSTKIKDAIKAHNERVKAQKEMAEDLENQSKKTAELKKKLEEHREETKEQAEKMKTVSFLHWRGCDVFQFWAANGQADLS